MPNREQQNKLTSDQFAFDGAGNLLVDIDAIDEMAKTAYLEPELPEEAIHITIDIG